MKIEVTREHIARGVAGDCNRCSVALAVADAIPPAEGCRVHIAVCNSGIGITMTGPDGYSMDCESFDTPWNVRDFIADFDDGEPVSPIAFDLPIDHLVPRTP
jgi:hypothetical protein